MSAHNNLAVEEKDAIAMASEGDPVLFNLCAYALGETNDIRTAVGIGEGTLAELPKGVKNNAESCVLAQALRNGWKSDIGDAIRLYRDVNDCEGIDFDKIVASLNQMEFHARVLMTDPLDEGAGVYDEATHDYKTDPDWKARPYGVTITHTWVTQEFINKFDSGYLPHLDLFESRDS